MRLKMIKLNAFANGKLLGSAELEAITPEGIKEVLNLVNENIKGLNSMYNANLVLDHIEVVCPDEFKFNITQV
jgi:hypothetical protein